MDVTPSIFYADVMHKRLFPKVNQFAYRVYYLALPIAQLRDAATQHKLAINHSATMSFHEKDHGLRDGSALEEWINAILSAHQLDEIIEDVVLICMPRILGYVFNPVSFWMCLDKDGCLRAVVCEVKNTFGETHSYVCVHEDKREISGDDWLEAEKMFHVSPFLEREGTYHFRFSLKEQKLGVWIDYYTNEGNKQLITALTGEFKPLTRSAMRKVFWTHPLVTFKTIALIHWQALKLFSKGVRYIVKPKQKQERRSYTRNLTKM